MLLFRWLLRYVMDTLFRYMTLIGAHCLGYAERSGFRITF